MSPTPSRTRAALRFLTERPLATLAGALPLALLFTAALIHRATGQTGWVELSASELALLVDYRTGAIELVDKPGYLLHWPWLQRALVLNKSSLELKLGAGGPNAALAAPVTVRSRDGSSFWFEGLAIQYQVAPEALTRLAAEIGLSGAAHRRWIDTAARAFAAEEYGRFEAEAVTDAENLDAAKVETRERLAAMLGPRGLRVVQIVAPKPRFEREYERAIDERKLAAQEVDELRADADDALRTRRDRLEALDRQWLQELAALSGSAREKQIGIETEEVKIRHAAESYRIERASAAAVESAKVAEEARQLVLAAEAEAVLLEEEVAELETRGLVAVREALAETLASVPIALIPYRHDREPERVEQVGPTGGN